MSQGGTAARNEVWTESHEPRGGWQRRLGPLHVTGIVWYRATDLLARLIPWPLLWLLTYPITGVCWLLLREVRRGITANLDVVLGPCGWFRRELRIFRSLHAFGLCMLDRYTLYRDRSRLQVEFEGGEHWQRLADSGKGFIFVSAHIGNWEVGSLIPGTVGRRIHVLREPAIDPRAQQLLERCFARYASDTFTLHFAGDDPSLGTKLLVALRRGDVVGLAGDQPRLGQSFLRVQMFDHPTPLPHGPIALGRAAAVPVVPVFALRQGRLRYRVIVCTPIEADPELPRQEALAQGTQSMAQAMEAVIRRDPHAWNCWWARWPGQSGR